MLSALAVWLPMFGLWILLVGSTDTVEILGGVVSATIASGGFLSVRSRDETRVSFRAHQIATVLRRVLPRVVVDCARVLGAVWPAVMGKRIHGRMVHVPFRPGADGNPVDAARRALVVFGISVAPNTLVVRIESRAILEHQLLPRPVDSSDPEWPV